MNIHDLTQEVIPHEKRRKSRRHSMDSIVWSQPRRRRKGVSFTKLVNVRATLHANDMTSDEISKTWYTPEELYKLKNQLVSEDDDDDDSRGLETRSQEWRSRRHRRVFTCLNLVMGEQDSQYRKGEYDPEIIREKYAAATSKSQAGARRLGRKDELFVRSIIENEIKSTCLSAKLINGEKGGEHSIQRVENCPSESVDLLNEEDNVLHHAAQDCCSVPIHEGHNIPSSSSLKLDPMEWATYIRTKYETEEAQEKARLAYYNTFKNEIMPRFNRLAEKGCKGIRAAKATMKKNESIDATNHFRIVSTGKSVEH